MKTDAASTGYLWCVFSILLCLNLPFIVCDFVFAGRGGCVDSDVSGFSITLATWLQVEGACRIAICSLFLICAFTSCFNLEGAIRMLVCTFCILILYSLFSFAWLVVGAVMFWGKLDKTKECSSQVTGYMYALLIMGFIGVCANFFASNRQRKSNQET